MQVGPMRQAKKGPIIVSQHYGLSDLSGFQNMQGGPSSLSMQPSPFYFEGAQATPFYVYNMPSYPGTPNWQTHMPSHSATPDWQTHIPSHPYDGKNVNVSSFNLGNAFVDDNVGADDVMIMGARETDN
nr:hypothetical protein [Tanacetum cinerariifolium]